jgi:hypothetical protein
MDRTNFGYFLQGFAFGIVIGSVGVYYISNVKKSKYYLREKKKHFLD